MPYQPTWVNPYMQGQTFGQQMAPVQQPQQAVGWGQPSTWPQQQQQPVNLTTKVNGRESALQYQLPPNSMSPPLIDSSFDGEKGIFYVVSTDGTGTKSVESFDFYRHVDQQPIQIDGAQFVSRQEYDMFVAKVNAALEVINSGIYGHVQTTAGPSAYGAEGAYVNASADDAGRPIANHQQPASDQSAVRTVRAADARQDA